MTMNRDAYLTRAQAALITRMRESTIGNWRARGWVTPEGERRHLAVRKQADGTLKYRLGDILDAERDTRNNPKSRRGGGRLAALRAADDADPSRDNELPRAGHEVPRFHCPPRPTFYPTAAPAVAA
ncbi:hypothetical protein [Micromonospora arborensis]|uniref:hypothetical protein n=1 Tax=Micromonospora arborensis TaxID=2116518 RepID=UPI0037150CB0